MSTLDDIMAELSPAAQVDLTGLLDARSADEDELLDEREVLPEGWTIAGTVEAAKLLHRIARALATNTPDASLCDVWDDMIVTGGGKVVGELEDYYPGAGYDEDEIVDAQQKLTDEYFFDIVTGGK